MRLIDKLKITVPFSYMWLLKISVGNPKTILDLGCEDGRLLELLSDGKDWQVTGVDIFQKNIKAAAKRKIFVEAIRGDIVTIAKNLIKKKKKYDVVFCSQVIEHIDRRHGEELLHLIDKLAKDKIVIGTPRGFMEQPEAFLGDNPHQVHKSGWTEDDFRKRGYKVYGVGFGPIWSEEGFGRSYNKFILSFAYTASFIFSPFVYFLPSLAAGILCIKEVRNEK